MIHTLSDKFDAVKQAVSILEVIEYYGLPIRKNRIQCKSHGGTEYNCAIYPSSNRFYCFVCGKSGDIIDLVAQIDGLSRMDALKKVNKEFHCFVDIMYDKPVTKFDSVISEIRRLTVRLKKLKESDLSSPVYREIFHEQTIEFKHHDSEIAKLESVLERLKRVLCDISNTENINKFFVEYVSERISRDMVRWNS